MVNRKDTNHTNNILEEIHDYNISVETREIFLQGHMLNVEEDPGVDFRMAMKFIKNLNFLASLSNEDIKIHQYSIGGEWESGMAIYDAIKLCKCHISFVCHGLCASMGSIIVQAADERISMPNCLFLLHEGSTGVVGASTMKQANTLLNWENSCTKLMMEIYIDGMMSGKAFKGYSEARVKSFLQRKFNKHEDWLLTANEAVEYGLIDNVY